MNMEMVKLDKFKIDSPLVFEVESRMSIEEKIEFIDNHRDNVATHLLNLFNKWEEEKGSLPQRYEGVPKKVSTKAWLKRNDTTGIIDTKLSVGAYRLFGKSFGGMSKKCSNLGGNVVYKNESVVNEWFHGLLRTMYREEVAYFEEHDPYTIKLKLVRALSEQHNTVFSCLELNDIVWNRNSEKKVSENNLDLYLEAFNKIEEAKETIERELKEKLL